VQRLKANKARHALATLKRSNTILEILNIKTSNIAGRNAKVKTWSLLSLVGTLRAFFVSFSALGKSNSQESETLLIFRLYKIKNANKAST